MADDTRQMAATARAAAAREKAAAVETAKEDERMRLREELRGTLEEALQREHAARQATDDAAAAMRARGGARGETVVATAQWNGAGYEVVPGVAGLRVREHGMRRDQSRSHSTTRRIGSARSGGQLPLRRSSLFPDSRADRALCCALCCALRRNDCRS